MSKKIELEIPYGQLVPRGRLKLPKKLPPKTKSEKFVAEIGQLIDEITLIFKKQDKLRVSITKQTRSKNPEAADPKFLRDLKESQHDINVRNKLLCIKPAIKLVAPVVAKRAVKGKFFESKREKLKLTLTESTKDIFTHNPTQLKSKINR